MAKSPGAFRSISEAAEEVGAPQHVLRFWETKFEFVTPVKRAGGRRFYRPQDVLVLKTVKRLLHDDGLTIRGVQRLHKEQGLKKLVGADAADLIEDGPREQTPTPDAARLETSGLQRLLADLEQAKARLDAILAR
ncbi:MULTISPECIES: MerR family transcriptional regulator [unclassified Brevundimonas]|uniref:MerR family transcriptional regulator n=1 Tax=unclassified Brevundimonas TaxID=2622653 RepID=UPI000E86EDDD|nr:MULTISPECIES: MerR family transcriptional regulator [unclassified Brevundimonas]MCK6103113.1 MerR family transcriptional regulator [Brevundimonas sp. EYE_349]HBI18414.1 MerR family transcriptional regulator [Brevundimonas sp.]